MPAEIDAGRRAGGGEARLISTWRCFWQPRQEEEVRQIGLHVEVSRNSCKRSCVDHVRHTVQHLGSQ